MKSYIDIVNKVMTKGVWSENRTGVDTRAISGVMFEHDMSDGFPLLTTKYVPFKLVAVELEGFIKGVTDKKWFQDRNCHIWDEWSNKAFAPEFKSDAQEKQYQLENTDLGALGYSHQWRSFNGAYKPEPFIWTGLDRTITLYNENDPIVGNVYEGKYGKYTVISFDGKDEYCNKRFTVKFNKTGYVKSNLNKDSITNKKNVFDPYYPNIQGVACLGDYKNQNQLPDDIVDLLKNSWKQMVHRCYNPRHPAYKNYGAKKVFVHNRWLIFENYLHDVQFIENWDKKITDWGRYELDKDLSGKGYYSKNTCSWITIEDNANCTSQNYYFDAISPFGKKFKNMVGLSKFCRKMDLDIRSVEQSIINDTYTQGGWKFYKKEKFVACNTSNGVDQLKNMVETLKTNPDDRRMIVSAWNPMDLHEMALPPCHYGFQVTVINGRLNLLWNQRSVDVALGLPFNIASYGLLLMLLAKESGFRPGRLVGFLGNTHIYENHINGLEEQVRRYPFKPPVLKFEKFSSIFDWEHTDCSADYYRHHPKISFDIAV